MDIEKVIKELVDEFNCNVILIKTSEDIEFLRIKFLGKKSPFRSIFEQLTHLPSENKIAIANKVNRVKSHITAALLNLRDEVRKKEISREMEAEWLDLSLPGIKPLRGSRHPVSLIERKCTNILKRLGFALMEGPEIETEYYNFDALNIPKHHPARDMQDTFFLENNLLLRSHATTVQARVLETTKKLPIKIISAGRVYRDETMDSTHLAMFHQFEGVWLAEGLRLPYLKGLLNFLMEELFGNERKIRFKPKFYPYTEPSIGVDISVDNGTASPGWITIVGAGMVHAKVLKEFGFNPDKIQGIAFGMGLSRIAAQIYKVKNMRSLYEADLRVHKALGSSKTRYTQT